MIAINKKNRRKSLISCYLLRQRIMWQNKPPSPVTIGQAHGG